MEDISQVTDVDIRLSESAGLVLHEHSGVVELVVRTVDHHGTRDCGCAQTSTGYTSLPIDEDTLAQIADGYGELMKQHYDESMSEEIAWRSEHSKYDE